MDDDKLSIFKIFAPTLMASRSEDGKLRIEGIASSTVRDHHGDQLTVKALEKMASSARGMTIFMNHSYNVPADVFGRVEKVRLDRTGERDPKSGAEIYDLRMGIVVTKSNAQAVQTFEQIEDGTRLGLSIGAMIPDGGATFSKEDGGRYIVDDVDLVETSVVGVPANPRSWIDYAVKGLAGKFPEKLEKERTAMRDVLEAEGATTVEVAGQGLVDEPVAEPVEPDINDSATSDQEDPEGEDAQIPVDDDSAATNTTTLLQNGTVESGTSTSITNNGTFTPATVTTVQPDATLSRVTVWDGDKVVEVDTGRSKPKSDGDQSAQAEPDTAGGSSAAGDVTKDVGDVALVAADTTLQSSRAVIASLTGQLAASRAETDEVREDLAAAIELARKAMEGTQTILETLQATPMGRKTGFVEAVKSFDKLRDDIYDPDVIKLLKKGTPA
jgi:hypothetical protein